MSNMIIIFFAWTMIWKVSTSKFLIPIENISCLYDNSSKTVTCSNKGLSSLPTFPSDAKKILLNNNKLKTINCSYIWPNATEYLDLSFNEIATFCFHNSLASLKYLYLRGNAFNYSFPTGIFKPIGRLEILDLKLNNPICQDDLVWNKLNELTSLKNLVSLSMDLNPFMIFPNTFSKLEKLQLLDMSCDFSFNLDKLIYCNHHVKCCLKHINTEIFSNLTYITNLTISDCDLQSIDMGAFGKMSHLKYLNVSNNQRLTFNALSNITVNLEETNIEILDLSKLHCPFGLSSGLFKQDLQGLKTTNLTQLFLDDNVLRIFEEKAILQLPTSLEMLSLRNNDLILGLDTLALSYLTNLKEVDLTHNFDVELTFQRIVGKTCPYLNCRESCSKYENRQNNIPKIHFNVTFELPPRLKTFKASHLTRFGPIDSIRVQTSNVLEHIAVSSSQLTSWVEPFGPFKHLRFLDLSNNYCYYISNNFFEQMPHLEELYVQKNILGANTQESWFKHLPALEILNISFNVISNLPKNMFLNQPKMRILDISENKLETFQVHIEHMKNLQLLILSGNRITNLTKEFMTNIMSIWKGNKIIKIDLRHNNLDCSCNTLDTLKWLTHHRHIFLQFDHLECMLKNESFVGLSKINSVIEELEKNCMDYSSILLISIFFLSFFVAFMTFACAYRYRWKIRYLYHIFRANEKANKLSKDSMFMYHAFISYAEDQSDFVTKDMVQNLEQEHGLKLCIHRRDFIPGKSIATNIASCVHNSKRTVFVLSQAFLNSYWCMYEFQMANMEGIYARKTREDILFLIIYEQMYLKQMPRDLLVVINQQSFIEFPGEEQGNVVFWKKLAEALKA